MTFNRVCRALGILLATMFSLPDERRAVDYLVFYGLLSWFLWELGFLLLPVLRMFADTAHELFTWWFRETTQLINVSLPLAFSDFIAEFTAKIEEINREAEQEKTFNELLAEMQNKASTLQFVVPSASGRCTDGGGHEFEKHYYPHIATCKKCGLIVTEYELERMDRE